MDELSPLTALLGGLLIGLAAASLMIFNGRIAGISGILADAAAPEDGERGWRWAFLAGLLAGGVAAVLLLPGAFETTLSRSVGALVVAGLLVGAGTQVGGGCTSGHGVCGIGRLSSRSIVATLTFMASAALTVVLVGRALGGAV